MDNKQLLNNLLQTNAPMSSADVPHKDAPIEDVNDPLLGLDEVSINNARQRMMQRAQQFQQGMKGPANQLPIQPRPNNPAYGTNQRLKELEAQIEFLKLRLECAEETLDQSQREIYKQTWLNKLIEVAGDDLMTAGGMGLLKKKQREQEEKEQEEKEQQEIHE